MGEKTGIEWCDSTFSPWWGCTKIAPACDHCYAAALDHRVGGDHWGANERRRTSVQAWNGPLKWQRQATAFMAEHGRARRVFCASMADVFDNQVPTEWRDDLWALIRACPGLDWQLLTKRPQNIAGMLPSFWDEVKSHVWLGTTVEDQKHADQNIPHLLKHDSAVRFLSCEPLLGPIDLTNLDPTGHRGEAHGINALWDTVIRRRVDWVITGGESGPHARPSHPEWFRSLRDQCKTAGVPFNFKQHGEWLPGEVYSIGNTGGHARHMDADASPFPGKRSVWWDGDTFGGHISTNVGKKAAGRSLDGVTHDGFPVVHL